VFDAPGIATLGSQYIRYFTGILFFSLPRKPVAGPRNFTDRLNKVIHLWFCFICHQLSYHHPMP
jgi:hypothetical protein